MLRVSIYCVEKDLLRPVTPNLMTQDASRAHYLDLAFSGDLISFHFLSFESEKQPSIPDVSLELRSAQNQNRVKGLAVR
jgi:hypothetical protein